MRLALNRFTYNAESQTYVAGASDFQIPVGTVPQDLVLADPAGRAAGKFVFERYDVHRGETTGFLYREVDLQNQHAVSRKVLLIND